MTIYARNGHVAVTIPAEGFGGCGNLHRRPVVNGAPARIWALDCEPCENHLRKDPHWSATIAKIPETFDEETARKDFEQRGALDERKLMAMALARLTGLEIPETITGAITGRLPHIPGLVECPSGHGQPPGMKFCGECGSPMHGPPSQTAIPAADKAVQPPANGRPRRLRDARADELVALARQRGLIETGTRADLISRLSAAGVTNNDLARLTPVAA